jgi:polysaccharide pyruvyl transferase WcaK-like protein
MIKTTAPRIALLHHTGGGNLGDDATLRVVVAEIRARWPNAVITALTINPDDTRARHGIPAFPLTTYTWRFGYAPEVPDVSAKGKIKEFASKHRFLNWFLKNMYGAAVGFPRSLFREGSFSVSALRMAWKLDLLIICGGGQLTERDGPWAFPYTIFRWVWLSKMVGVKCVFLNVGAGPLKRPLSRFFAKHALSAADYLSFRDEKSKTLARQIGFVGQSHVLPDCAYSLLPPAASEVQTSRKIKPIVGIAPLPYCDPRLGPTEANPDKYRAYIKKFADFSAFLIRQGYSLSLFGTDIGIDPLSIQDLCRALKGDHGLFVQPSPIHSVDDLLARMAEMDYIVTCRFHGVVLSHVLNKPVLAVSHHPKVTNQMKDLGLSEYCLDIDSFTPEQMISAFEAMARQNRDIKERMAEMLLSNRSQLKSQLDELFPSAAQETLVSHSSHAMMAEQVRPADSYRRR